MAVSILYPFWKMPEMATQGPLCRLGILKILCLFAVFRQLWGAGRLGVLQRAWARKVGNDRQFSSQNGPTMLIL